ncbi:adenylate/guanylate cyclase domain-containing protein [Bradyrhizobium sp. CB82]|uniref:adenylate/guanylate cyclase domain-containing protein n=1 Tax=Bradyrhizobium sp. CB82 TaxID=3039159 RepID=UPI0024B086BD|nr:adenylate/guanylate cyclase domain-containing protein [Bradyrhizobium sp. CB82]WFU38512.1 adenylate/guanylate cyclase domain-containing protein [Bradyrhizobium sp. CB82]
MASDQVKRKLAAILAADIAGYSRLMGADEAGTLARLKEYRRELIDPKNRQYRGRVVKTTGDGILIEFPSVVDAISCSIEVQLGMCERNADIPPEKRIEFRIGINLGDVIVEGRDLYGDGVNIAARLEGVAEPGGICISQTVLNHARGKIAFEFEDLGELALKNIVRPVHVYHLLLNSSRGDVASRSSEPPLALPDKPSIAVLPFQNMSDDPEQEYFADGMVEEITTALSRFKWLFVIARNSSFTFKGTSVDIKEVRRRLGVRYVLEGSVRKAAGKVRITGQLIDAATGAHLWADRFERDLTDVFALQDEVTVAVVSAIQPKLLQTEIAIATRRRPENLTAYDFFLRAMQQYYPMTREGLAETIRLAHRALELDPQFGFVAALAGACHTQKILQGYAIDPQFDRKEAVRLLRLALSVDDDDPDTLALACNISTWMVGDCESTIEMADKAVALNPNSFFAWYSRGYAYLKLAGLPEEGVRSFERAIRMNPVGPLLLHPLAGMGQAFIELRRFDEAILAGKKALRQRPDYSPAYRCLAAAFAHLGRDAEAREAAARLLEADPAFTISGFIARGGQSKAKLLIEGLSKAGLPE